MKTVTLKNGVQVPRLGQGTWFIGDNPKTRVSEIETLRRGIDLGMTLIDTAEMYGSGRSESLVGEAIAPYDREKLFLVSKVLPNNAGRKNIFQSCDRSLERLKTEYLDCYLLHWRGGVPLRETIDCMKELVSRGKIKSFGVSNLDTYDMEELVAIPGGDDAVTNQVLYHLGSRGIEYDLLPWLKKHNMAMMAYCPLAQGGSLRSNLLKSEAVRIIAAEREIDAFQVLLAFALHDPNIMAIPKASTIKHVEKNYQALSVTLTQRDIDLLSEDFPPPTRKMPLDIQ